MNRNWKNWISNMTLNYVQWTQSSICFKKHFVSLILLEIYLIEELKNDDRNAKLTRENNDLAAKCRSLEQEVEEFK